jgi:hypothetical protein
MSERLPTYGREVLEWFTYQSRFIPITSKSLPFPLAAPSIPEELEVVSLYHLLSAKIYLPEGRSKSNSRRYTLSCPGKDKTNMAVKRGSAAEWGPAV